MKAICILLSTCLLSSFCYGQKFNALLKKQLDSIMADDQRYRELTVLQPGVVRDSIATALHIAPDDVDEHYNQLQQALDSTNLKKVAAVIHKYGYPGKSMVGTPTNQAVYYVIQHSDQIKKYFPLIEAAGKKGELPFEPVAMMQDRMLKEEGKEQIYGTQYAGYAVTDSITHQKKICWLLWPVKDYAHVNERRKKAGFKDTVAENAADQGIEPKILTLAEARKECPWLFSKQ